MSSQGAALSTDASGKYLTRRAAAISSVLMFQAISSVISWCGQTSAEPNHSNTDGPEVSQSHIKIWKYNEITIYSLV